MNIVLVEKGTAKYINIEQGIRKLALKTEDIEELISFINKGRRRSISLWSDDLGIRQEIVERINKNIKVHSHKIVTFERYPDSEETSSVTIHGETFEVKKGWHVACNSRGLVVAFSHKPTYLEHIDLWAPNETKVIAYNLHEFDMTKLMEINPVTVVRVEGSKTPTMTIDQMNLVKLLNTQAGESCYVKGTMYYVEGLVFGHPNLMDREFSIDIRSSSTYTQTVRRLR